MDSLLKMCLKNLMLVASLLLLAGNKLFVRCALNVSLYKKHKMSSHPPQKGASLEVRKEWELQMQKQLVKEDMERPKAFKLGMITDSGYICIGDPYKAPGDAFDGGSRTKGLNFKVQGTKKGQFGKGVRFTPINPLCIGDPYMSAQERNFVQKKKAKIDAMQKESREASDKYKALHEKVCDMLKSFKVPSSTTEV